MSIENLQRLLQISRVIIFESRWFHESAFSLKRGRRTFSDGIARLFTAPGKSITHTHCEPKSGYAWFKTFKSFKPFKMSEKQSGAVERSAAIEHLERFDQLHCWLPIARDRSGLVLGNCRHESSVIRVLPSCRSTIGFCDSGRKLTLQAPKKLPHHLFSHKRWPTPAIRPPTWAFPQTRTAVLSGSDCSNVSFPSPRTNPAVPEPSTMSL